MVVNYICSHSCPWLPICTYGSLRPPPTFILCLLSLWNQWCLCYAAVVCLLCSPVRTDDACPSSCVCVPSDIPDTELEMSKLSLSYNGIQVIEPYAFLGLPRLHLLDLSHNQLESISARAFHGLPELRSLFLNYSVLPVATAQLSNALSAQTLRNLHRLELAGNQLKSIPLVRLDMYNLHVLVLINNSIERIGRENVTSLYQQRHIRVYLSLNPFWCDCELESFYYWLKNSSQCPDAGHLLCSEPEAKRWIPVEKLRGEDVDCMNENLEAVSYVFLGIVLALIGVVFLMVLYLNRGDKRRGSASRERRRNRVALSRRRLKVKFEKT
uniref:Trophoblast glycoprotein like n=1 Tax=Acanthochromis polyacanthus TaxID=80966 RepID=A0A3Q1FGM8_9TELE